LKKYFRSKAVITLLLVFFISGGNVYPQQASPVQEPVSSVGGVNTPSASVKQIGKDTPFVQADLNPYNITIPEQFGNIEEVFQGAQNSPLIVHIQNVHANYEAQVNIKAILNHLVEKYNFSLIQLEGAVSKLDPTILEPSYLKEANVKLVDFLMREGRITGADAFAVETNKSVDLYGIEDYNLYSENLKTFRAVYKHQEEMKTYFFEIHRLIQNVSPKLFNPENLDFTRKTEEFAGDKIDILDYLVYMNKLSEKHQLASLNDIKEIIHYPNLVRLMRLHQLEDQLNKSGLKKEIESLKLEFRKKMPDSEKVEKLLARLDANAKGVTPRSYFLELTQAADEAKIDFIGYPAFRIFAEFLIHQDEIDHRGLFSELKQFESYLQEKLFTADDDKTLLQIIDFVGLLEQYFRLEMSREKIALYLNHRDEIKPSWIANHLLEFAQKYQANSKPVGDLQKLDSYMDELEYFYQLVLKRDEVFTGKILGKMQSLGQDKTIIITGGFHKDGLMDHFRKENISYVIISPKVDVKQGSENYLKVMLDEDAVVGSVFAGTFALEIETMLNTGLLNDQLRELLANSYAAASVATTALDKREPKVVINALNQRLARFSSVSGIYLRATEPPTVEGLNNILKMRAAFKLEGKVRAFSLQAEYNSKSGQFRVQKIDEIRPTSEESKALNTPPSVFEVARALIAREELPGLSRISNPPTTILKSPLSSEQLSSFGFPVGIFSLPPNRIIPPGLTSTVEGLQSLSPAALDLLRGEVRKGVPLDQALSQARAESRIASFTPENVLVAVEDLVRQKQLAFFSSSVKPEPSVLVVPILEEKAGVKQLMALVKAVSEPGTAALVYGRSISKVLSSLGVSPELLKKIKVIDVPETLTNEQILKQVARDVNSAKYTYALYKDYVYPVSGGKVLNAIDFVKEGYVRVLFPENNPTISNLISSSVPQLASALARPKVIQGNLTGAFAVIEIEVLRRIPRPGVQGDEEEFRTLLRQYELSDIVVGKGGQWGIAAGVEALVGQLFNDFMTAVRVAVAA